MLVTGSNFGFETNFLVRNAQANEIGVSLVNKQDYQISIILFWVAKLTCDR